MLGLISPVLIIDLWKGMLTYTVLRIKVVLGQGQGQGGRQKKMGFLLLCRAI